MSYRIKVPPRTLPVDEAHLVSGLEHWVLGLSKYRWPLVIGVLLLVVMGAVIWGVLWYDSENASKAQELEREATRHLFARPSNDPTKGASNVKEAVTIYRRVVEEYPRTPSAPLAMFSLGNALLQSNEVDAALETYKRFTATYGANVSLLGLVQQKIGYAYLLKGDLDQAAKAYAAVLDITGSTNRDHALFELARLEESRSRSDEALKRYQDLISTYKDSPLAGEAAMRVKVLEALKTPVAAPAASAPTSPTAPASQPAASSKPAKP